MKLEELTKHITVFIDPLDEKGSYEARIRGSLPDGERIHFDLEMIGCYTEEILQDTVTAELEDILSCRYDYHIGEYDEDNLHYDGGNFS